MKATITLRLLIATIVLFLIAHTDAPAQQYQFTSNGRDGRDTVTSTRIINSYSKVTLVAGNYVYTHGSYVPQTRDRVLVIQMTGRDSGVWQWDTVRAGGNPCWLSNLYKPFDTANGGKIQIIKVPQYQSLYVRSTGTLTAAPWNDSTGGILTFMVRDTFKVETGGRCDVSYLGFLPRPDTSPAGTYGIGGAGGAGGAIGQNGGDSALVIGSGVGGGGDGGMFGQYGTAGDTLLYAHCPGCATSVFRDTATNLSLVDSGLAKNKFIMGGAGRTGRGGKGGRGGGGGGGGTAGPGTDGGHGGAGGRGGTGGRGGGIILFSSVYMNIPDSTLVFYAMGEDGHDGMPGDTGQAGGNGGPGIGPCTVGPGGGGRGAAGGSGGDGGGGGGGGVVFPVLFHTDSAYTGLSSLTMGGSRGRGGQGGPGGPGGLNGTTLSGTNCGGALATRGPDGDNGNGGNNGNNGTGAGGGSNSPGAIIPPCQGFGNYYERVDVGYGCTTQGYLPYFESTISGGAWPYTIFAEDTFSGDYTTDYFLTVADAAGCVSFRRGYVDQPMFLPTYDVTPSCPGMDNGALSANINVNGSYGTPPPCVQPVAHTAIYDINGNFLDSTTAYFLSAGYYYVAWWLNSDTVHYDTLQIEEVQPVTVTEALIQPTCSQPDGGAIQLQVSGESLCVWYSYLWSNQVNGLDNDNLTAGTYDLTVHYDGPSYCGQIANVYYDMNYQCVQTLSYTLDPPVGAADIYLDVDVCAGTPYTYNGVDYYAGLNVIPPANPGGCDTTVYLTVNEYYSPQGYEYHEICDGDMYYWEGNHYNQSGQYYATLYGADMHGCDSTIELDLYVMPPITAGNLADQYFGDGCASEPDYTALSVTGGDGNYSYVSSGSPVFCQNNISVYVYDVTITDGHGCTADEYVYVDYAQDEFMVSIDQTTPELCAGADNGTVSYTIYNTVNQECSLNGFWLDYTNNAGYTQNIPLGSVVSQTDGSLPPGSYTYSISGLGQCAQPVSGSFVIGAGMANPAGDEYDTICDGASFIWDFNYYTYSQSGTYTATATGGASTGCDTTANLHLYVRPPYAHALYDTIYQGQSVTVGGQQYSTAGSYYVFMLSVGGCDSSVTLHLYVQSGTPPLTTYLTESICAGASYTVGVHTYSSAGSYTDTLTAVSGQDSIVYLTLSVTQALSGTATASVCAGSSYTWGGNTYTQGGTYAHTFTAVSGCDSIVTLTLNVMQPITGTATAPICSGSSYAWGGNTYTQGGTYTHTFITVSGCDSIVTLTLNVIQPITGTATASICSGSSYTWGSNTYTQAGTYTHTFTAVSGCDSVVTLTLSVAQPITGTATASICSGSSYTWGGNTYTQAGTYTHTFTAVSGCDSIVTLALNVIQPIINTATASICSGSSYTWGGNTYTQAGTYTHTFTAVSGCDSVVILTLSVTQPVTNAATASICSGGNYTWAGNTYTQAGTFTHTFTGTNGCDSIVTLTLSVTQAVTSTATASICSGSNYTWGGNTYTQAGTYTHSFTAVSGCDSIVTLTLSVAQPITNTATASICSGSSYTWGGNTYTQAGTYTHSFTAVNGCDSVVTLVLNVTSTISTSLTDTICQGSAYVVGHNSYTVSGTYTDVLSSAGGCDSVQTLHLVVLQSVTPSLFITVSHGPVINGQQIDTFRASYTACDGAFYSWYLNLLPQGLHDSIAVIAHFVNQADSIVCRIDCENRCASTTYTYSNRIMSGISEPGSMLRAVNVYPNPNTGAFTLDVNSITAATGQISLLDVIGQPVLTGQIYLSQGDSRHTVVLPEAAASGVYIIQLTVQGQTHYDRISVER